jgi:uncharacterized membrane protein
MTMTRTQLFTANRVAFLLLFALSFFSMAMMAARITLSEQIYYSFLVWNLFLAWLPFLFAAAAITFRRSLFVALFFGFLWLLFFPNAPYLITDLIHLRPLDPIPLWYDAIMLFSFALSGLLLGLRSLSLMHTIVEQKAGLFAGWLFVVVAAVLSSFGIYIGRFLRWNSWDIFANPLRLFVDVAQSLSTPFQLFKAMVVVLLFSAVTIGAYLFWNDRGQLARGGGISPPG